MKVTVQEFNEWAKRFSLDRIKLRDVPDEFRAVVADYQRRIGEGEMHITAAHNCRQLPCFQTAPRPKINDCTKCGGTGHIRAFSHIEGGKCFACQV